MYVKGSISPTVRTRSLHAREPTLRMACADWSMVISTWRRRGSASSGIRSCLCLVLNSSLVAIFDNWGSCLRLADKWRLGKPWLEVLERTLVWYEKLAKQTFSPCFLLLLVSPHEPYASSRLPTSVTASFFILGSTESSSSITCVGPSFGSSAEACGSGGSYSSSD